MDPARRYRGMYCRQCRYALRGVTGNRCPECGAKFSDKDVSTYLVDVNATDRIGVVMAAASLVFVVACTVILKLEWAPAFMRETDAWLVFARAVVGLVAVVGALMAAATGKELRYCLNPMWHYTAMCVSVGNYLALSYLAVDTGLFCIRDIAIG